MSVLNALQERMIYHPLLRTIRNLRAGLLSEIATLPPRYSREPPNKRACSQTSAKPALAAAVEECVIPLKAFFYRCTVLLLMFWSSWTTPSWSKPRVSLNSNEVLSSLLIRVPLTICNAFRGEAKAGGKLLRYGVLKPSIKH